MIELDGVDLFALFQVQNLEELAASVGARNVYPTVVATNGDWNAREFIVKGTIVQNGAALVWLDRAVTGGVRINYSVTFPV